MSTKNAILVLRLLGWLEGGSFLLLLCVGMPLKYLNDNPSVVKTLGMPHGILFLAFVIFANMLAEELNWSLKIRFFAILAAVLPFGTFIFDHKYLKTH